MKKSLILFFIFLNATTSSYCQTASKLIKVTNHFTSTLSVDQLHKISFEFDHNERTNWTNLPVGLAKRPGLNLGELSAESKMKFHKVLTSILSSQGYLKTTSIMQLDDILNTIYKSLHKQNEITQKTFDQIVALDWDYSHYYISIWGTPNNKTPWGLKFEGHHISINISAIGNKYSMTPLFIGSDPAEVQITKHAGLRVLSKEEDYGLELINSLTTDQQKIATISQEVPKDIITNPNSPQMINGYQGIKGSELNEEQKKILIRLIKEYIQNLEHEKSEEYLNKIKRSGIENIYFAWRGSYKIREPNYYVINGPDFIIEYDNYGFNNDGNHIHAIWREKGNDFGEDILKKHYLEHKH